MGLSLSFEDTPGPGQYRLPGSVAQKDSCPVARRASRGGESPFSCRNSCLLSEISAEDIMFHPFSNGHGLVFVANHGWDRCQVLRQLHDAGPVCHTAAGRGEPREVLALHEGHEPTATGLGLLAALQRARRLPSLHPGPRRGRHGPDVAAALPGLWARGVGHRSATGREGSGLGSTSHVPGRAVGRWPRWPLSGHRLCEVRLPPRRRQGSG